MARFQTVVMDCHWCPTTLTYYPVRPVSAFFDNSVRSRPSGRELPHFSTLHGILTQPDEITRVIHMLNDARVVLELAPLVRRHARCVQLLVCASERALETRQVLECVPGYPPGRYVVADIGDLAIPQCGWQWRGAAEHTLVRR